MVKKQKILKLPKKEEENLHLKVVLLDDTCELLMKNVISTMDILYNAAFCVECSKKKTK